jgi:rhodanese-related sulfurtransferase
MPKRILIALAIPVLLLALRGVAPADGGVSVAEAAAMIKEKRALQIVDVRTEGEYAAGHLAHAKLIPLHQLEGRLGEIDGKKPVLLYCHSGHRSGQALRLLTSKGFADVKHIEGGLAAWQAAGLPVTR